MGGSENGLGLCGLGGRWGVEVVGERYVDISDARAAELGAVGGR